MKKLLMAHFIARKIVSLILFAIPSKTSGRYKMLRLLFGYLLIYF